ncbi:MAG: hypothetical protein GY909_06445 [Oligoflexia bacterium]|nr:hypothetical protein [Oligoflexia bacterium]
MAANIILILLLIVGCNKKFSESKVVTSSYNHQEVLQSNCFSCHKDYSNYSNQDWINVGLVIPGIPEKSPLMRSLKGFHHGGKRNMPPTPNRSLTPQEIEVLYTWISGLEAKTNRKQIKITDFSLENFKSTKPLSKNAVKQRCFEQITQLPLQASTQLKSCDDLFLGLTTKKNKYAHEVIRSIHQLHTGWFNSYNFHTNNENWGTYEILDVNTPALYLTDTFIYNKSIDNLFKRQYSPKAIRSDKQQEYLIFKPSDNYKVDIKRRMLSVGNDKTAPQKWLPKPSLIQTGILTNIGNWLPTQAKIDNYYKNDLEREPIKVNADFHRGLGGGVLGDKTYLTLNFGHSSGTIMDGEAKVMRSWSKAVFKEFLCRDLPVVNGQDSVSFIEEESSLSFRRNQSCLRCHASIDTLAGTTRNFTLGLNNLIAESVDPESNKAIHLQVTVPINTNEVLDKTILTKYSQNKSTGQFYYRDNKGKLHNKEVQNLDQLSDYLLELDDFYECVTKRYVKHFTGHDINIDTLYFESENSTEAYLKRFIIAESKKLKKNKSLVSLANNILNSVIYQDINFEVTR